MPAADAAADSGAMAGMEMPADSGADGQTLAGRGAFIPQQAPQLGITYTVVRREPLTRMIRTVGQIQVPESTLVDITPKVDGFVERLFVNYTGETVKRGQPLLELYSPMLVAAQNELLTARHLATHLDSSSGEAWANAQALVESARRRLAYWDITPLQIAELERTEEVTKTLTFVAPFDGVVLEKMVVQGQQVMPGMKLYRLGSVSTVWIEGEVFEQDVHFIRLGSPVTIELASRPGERRSGRVSFIYPTVNEASRTNRVRVTVPNIGLALKPGMYATLYFHTTFGGAGPTIPLTAVVMTGERNIVFVRDTGGVLTPRDVVLGASGTERVEVVRGLQAGDTVVTSANFLVDAESRLTAGGPAMAGMAGMEMPPPAARPSTVPSTPEAAPGPGRQAPHEGPHD